MRSFQCGMMATCFILQLLLEKSDSVCVFLVVYIPGCGTLLGLTLVMILPGDIATTWQQDYGQWMDVVQT